MPIGVFLINLVTILEKTDTVDSDPSREEEATSTMVDEHAYSLMKWFWNEIC